MKISVILGVLHMTIGIIHKGSNAIHFKRYPDLVFEVILGLVILLGLFGWMDLLIIFKWFTPLDLTERTIDSINKTKYQVDI